MMVTLGGRDSADERHRRGVASQPGVTARLVRSKIAHPLEELGGYGCQKCAGEPCAAEASYGLAAKGLVPASLPCLAELSNRRLSRWFSQRSN
jgi:hypothetical protein